MTEHRRSQTRFLPTYATLVGLPVLALLVILRVGTTTASRNQSLVSPPNPAAAHVATSAARVAASAVPNLPLLLAQIVVILVAARIVGAVVRRLGQPRVVGEVLAGIALGPSVLGAQAPRGVALSGSSSTPRAYVNAGSQRSSSATRASSSRSSWDRRSRSGCIQRWPASA